MSFILDALRKSELERQRQSGPSIAELPIARDDRRLPMALVAIGVLLAVNVAVLLYFMMRAGPEPVASVAATPITETAGTQAASPATTAASAPAAAVAGETENEPPPETSSRSFDAPDPTLLAEAPAPAAGNVTYTREQAPPVETLPAAAAADLPALAIDLHIYSSDPAKRAVFINGRRYTEGATILEGPVVEEITTDGAVLSHRGQRFQLPRN